MSSRFAKSLELHQAACAVMPKGVSSNMRAWGKAGALYVSKAQGAYVWDADGNRYIDYRLGFGPIILGYAYEEVDTHVLEAIRDGIGSGLTSEMEVHAASRIVRMCPGIERVRFVNSGTEATMHAIRLARAYTGREKILKFEGGYHGGHDYVLFSTYASPQAYGSRTSPIAVPASSGIPRHLQDMVLTLPFNDREALERTLRSVGHKLAAIIMEPMLGNYGCVEPQPGFLPFVRARCDEYGMLLLLDEVKTGFRVARGGAQELYGVRADLVTYAKALGNGYAVAAYGGRAAIMELMGEGVSQGGTFSGNAVGVAAADATLRILEREPVLEHVAESGTWLRHGIQANLQRAGIRAVISGYPSIFGVAFAEQKPVDGRDWARTDLDFYRRFAAALLERGVLVDPDPREPWCLSYSHSKEDLDRTLDIVADAVASLPR